MPRVVHAIDCAASMTTATPLGLQPRRQRHWRSASSSSPDLQPPLAKTLDEPGEPRKCRRRRWGPASYATWALPMIRPPCGARNAIFDSGCPAPQPRPSRHIKKKPLIPRRTWPVQQLRTGIGVRSPRKEPPPNGAQPTRVGRAAPSPSRSGSVSARHSISVRPAPPRPSRLRFSAPAPCVGAGDTADVASAWPRQTVLRAGLRQLLNRAQNCIGRRRGPGRAVASFSADG